ncbi:MAG: twin-arginine translocase TatA/TatE family subunit [Candidatus Aminicenantales bacterium]
MFFLGPIGPTELILIIVVIILLFGAKRLPELGKSLGAGIKNFRKSISGKDEKQSELSSEKKEKSEKEE